MLLRRVFMATIAIGYSFIIFSLLRLEKKKTSTESRLVRRADLSEQFWLTIFSKPVRDLIARSF